MTYVPNVGTTGLASDILHLCKRGYHESVQRGEPNQTLKMAMGGTLVFIGATMMLGALNKTQQHRLTEICRALSGKEGIER